MATLLITIMMILEMVKLFPYTGLGRIISIPATIVINLAIIVLGTFITRNMKNLKCILIWIGIILLTASNTMTFHPQEYSPSVYKQIGYSISAVKFKEELPLDGSFILHESVDQFGVNPSIRSIDEIPEKLVGHYRVIWWVLDTFKSQ